jgi:hypothetical protein
VRGKAGAGRSAWARGSRARRAGPRRVVMLGCERDAGRGAARAARWVEQAAWVAWAEMAGCRPVPLSASFKFF